MTTIRVKNITQLLVGLTLLFLFQGCGGGGGGNSGNTPISNNANSSLSNSSVSASTSPTDKPTKAANDNFGSRVNVEGFRPILVGTLLNATLEKDELLPFGMNGATSSVWYQWKSPANGRVTVQKFAEENGNLGTGDIALYKGDRLSTLVEIRPYVNYQTGWPLVFTIEAGVTYQIQVIGSTSAIVSPFRFHLNATQVSNDNFSTPVDLIESAGSTKDLTLLNGSVEASEPNTDPNDIAPEHSSWFRFTADTIPGKLKININSLVGGAFHNKPVINFYTGTTLNTLSLVKSDISFLSVFDIQPFHTYYIQLFNRGPIYLASSFDDPAYLFDGAFNFNWKLFIAPANDNFSNAKDITLAPDILSGFLPDETTLAATREVGEQQHSYNVLADKTSQGSIWYKWTAPKTGLFAFKTKDQSRSIRVNSLIGIYQGDTLETLIKEIPMGLQTGNTISTGTLVNAIAPKDVIPNSQAQATLAGLVDGGEDKYGCLELKATEGVSYYIAVDSIDHQIPNFVFEWTYFERNNASSNSSSSSSSVAAGGEGCRSSQP